MIQVDHLIFSYTKKPFIQDICFSGSEGEIFGFLGPSGAGKSTLQKILLGMLPDYQGSAIVNGTECKHHHQDFYESIGVDFEFSTMYEKLSARENLCFFSSLYHKQLQRLIAEKRLQSIHSSEPTLNNIFMEITGRTLV